MNTPEAMRTDGWLVQELETYYTHKAELLGEAEGKFVLIKGERIVGIYETEKEAFDEGLRRFRMTGYLARKIHQGEKTIYIGGGGPEYDVPIPGEDAMELTELIREKREDILRIADRHGASNVRVFGSASRGEGGPDSDLDILVDVGPKPSPWFPAGLALDLEDLLGRRVDVATPNALHWFIRDRVLSEAKPL